MAKQEIYVSQIPYLLPDRAMHAAAAIQEKLGLSRIGVEVKPLRWNATDRLLALKRETGVQTAVAGVTTRSYGDYMRDMWNFRTDPKVLKEILMNVAAIGAQTEPGWARRFGTHLQLAVALGAPYLAMHEEPTRHLQRNGKLGEWAGTRVLYGRKLGWGPQDNRPQVLSWDIEAISRFVTEGKEYGWNIGAILPTDTALRTGLSLPDESKQYDLERAWNILQPEVIQVGDYHPEGKREKLKPGDGLYSDQLAALIQESSRVHPGTIYAVEVENPVDVLPTVEFVLQNWRGDTPQISR